MSPKEGKKQLSNKQFIAQWQNQSIICVRIYALVFCDVTSIFCLYSRLCFMYTDLLCLRFNFETSSSTHSLALCLTFFLLFLLARNKWSHVRLIYFMSPRANKMSQSKCVFQFVVCSRWNFSYTCIVYMSVEFRLDSI